MQIVKIGNGWLAGPLNTAGIEHMHYYPTLSAIEAAMNGGQPAAEKAEAPAPVAAPVAAPAPAEAPKRRGRPPKNRDAAPAADPTPAASSAEPSPATATAPEPTPEPTPEPAADAQPQGNPAPAVEAKAYSADDLRNELAAVNAKGGLQLCKDVLARVGATRISEVTPENAVKFIQYCRYAAEHGHVDGMA